LPIPLRNPQILHFRKSCQRLARNDVTGIAATIAATIAAETAAITAAGIAATIAATIAAETAAETTQRPGSPNITILVLLDYRHPKMPVRLWRVVSASICRQYGIQI